MASAAAAPTPGPSAVPLALELSHVRYFIDSSVAKGVKSKVGHSPVRLGRVCVVS